MTKVIGYNYGIIIITPYHFRTKSKDDAILPHSRGPRSPDPFWTKVQGWYNPTTFSSTEVIGSVLNKSSGMINPTTFLSTEDTGSVLNKSLGMIQSHHIIEGQSHQICSDQEFKDYTIPPHSRGSKSLDPFWTRVQGWYNLTTFLRTESTGSL